MFKFYKMKYLACILISAGIIAVCNGKPLDEYNQPFISNMYAQAMMAQKYEAVSNYVEATTRYKLAIDQLANLMANAAIPLQDGRKQMKVWQQKIEKLQPVANRLIYIRLAEEYGRQLGEFAIASEKNDITGMSIALKNCELLFEKAGQIYPSHAVPSELPVLKPVRDLRLQFFEKLTIARRLWFAKENFSPYQIQVISELMSATSLATHITWLDTVQSKQPPGISLPWLENVYRKLAVQEPTVFAYWYGLGNSLQLQNKPAKANLVWHDALKYFPESSYVHYHLARTCRDDRQDATRAMSHLRWLVPRASTPVWKAKIFHQMAIRYSQLDDLTNSYLFAERAAEQVVHELSAGAKAMYVEAKRTKCTSLLKLGRREAAVAALEEAVRTVPDDLSLKIELADMFSTLAVSGTGVNEQYFKSAFLWYDTILRDYPDLPSIHASKAFLHLRAGEYMKAQAEAVRELTIRPDSLSALTTLGYTYLSQNKTVEAKVLFKKALDFDPECSAALKGLDAVAKAEAVQKHTETD
jgi:tetratricopeptide (TPR) repeat protein